MEFYPAVRTLNSCSIWKSRDDQQHVFVTPIIKILVPTHNLHATFNTPQKQHCQQSYVWIKDWDCAVYFFIDRGWGWVTSYLRWVPIPRSLRHLVPRVRKAKLKQKTHEIIASESSAWLAWWLDWFFLSPLQAPPSPCQLASRLVNPPTNNSHNWVPSRWTAVLLLLQLQKRSKKIYQHEGTQNRTRFAAVSLLRIPTFWFIMFMLILIQSWWR